MALGRLMASRMAVAQRHPLHKPLQSPFPNNTHVGKQNRSSFVSVISEKGAAFLGTDLDSQKLGTDQMVKPWVNRSGSKGVLLVKRIISQTGLPWLKGGLRSRIITWSFVPTAIILVAVALVSLYTYERVTEHLVLERDRELTRLSAELLSTELTAYTDPVADQYMAIFDGIILFDAAGEIVLAEPMMEKPDWFEQLPLPYKSDSKTPVFSNIVVDRPKDEELIVVVMPFASQGRDSAWGMAGFFHLDARADNALKKSIERLRRRESSCIYLVDGSGRVIYHSNPEYVGQDFSQQTVVELVTDGLEGAYRTRNLEGEDIVASFASVPGTSWGLITEESWAALTQSSQRYKHLLFALLAMGIIVPTIIVTVGVRRITQPITQVIRAAQEIAGGRFGRRITAPTGDEMEELAKQFNRMASQLEASYAHLEQKVADRTRELATLNAISAQASHSLDLKEILHGALDQILEAVNMDTGQAFSLEEETQTLISIAHRGLSPGSVECTASLSLQSSLAGEAADQGHPIVWKLADPPESDMQYSEETEGLQIVISVPLIAQGRMVGAINLGSRDFRLVTPEELALLASIGQQIGVAVDNARLYEQAQELAVMKERSRLSRDLHDSVTQSLYGVTLYAEAAARQLILGDTDAVADHLRELRATAQESLREMRLLIFELRLPTLKSEGLAAALQMRLEAVEEKVGLETSFTADGDGRLPPEIEEGLYRIAQEALNNALKHAHADRVSVHLHHSHQGVTLEIADDGVGFDLTAKGRKNGFGLRGMAERAAQLGGELTVQSSPDLGTCIRVEVCV
jgi:signal transduction histidine kinase